jgi:amino acid transporter
LDCERGIDFGFAVDRVGCRHDRDSLLARLGSVNADRICAALYLCRNGGNVSQSFRWCVGVWSDRLAQIWQDFCTTLYLVQLAGMDTCPSFRGIISWQLHRFILFSADSWFATFSLTLIDLSALLPGITFKLTGPILVGMATILVSFYLQHSGILRMARAQFLLAILSLVPILLLSFVPLLTGKVSLSHFVPFIPEGVTDWQSPQTFTLLMGGMFIAGWTTYACEAAMCYVSEFKNPDKDTIRAVTSSGLLAIVAFGVLPFTFLGVLGMETLKDPAFVAGDPQSAIVKMAQMTFGSGLGIWLTIMLIMAVILSIVTAMAGASRTLYQSSKEGWLPKFLGQVNSHGVPTQAMWVDITFNIFLLLLGNPIFVLAASSTAYMIGVVMNLSAAWIHRRDRPTHYRLFRAPDWLINIGAPILALLNATFIIFGANYVCSGCALVWVGSRFDCDSHLLVSTSLR